MDGKAIKLLTRYYCPSAYGGVEYGDQNTPAKLAYLRAQGIQPEAVLHVSHEQAVARLRKAAAAADLRGVADAFLVGLAPKRSVHRAALRAFAIGMHFPEHAFQPHNPRNPCPACRTCGMSEEEEVYPAYLEMLCHRDGACGFSSQPCWAAYALERFTSAAVPRPTYADCERFAELLRVIRDAGPRATVTVLANAIRPLVQGNKYTRGYLLETLGYCSILETQQHKGYLTDWVPWIERERSRTGELDLPAALWRGNDGLNLDALRHFFPHLQLHR